MVQILWLKFNWNQTEAAKSLGIGKKINLSIEPSQAVEQVVNLVSSKLGEKGEVRLRLLFQPKIFATFMNADRAITQIGSNPPSAGKSVFHGVAGVFRHKEAEETIPEDSSEIPHPTQDASDKLVRVAENGQPAPGEPGTLKVAVMDVNGLTSLDIKPFAEKLGTGICLEI